MKQFHAGITCLSHADALSADWAWISSADDDLCIVGLGFIPRLAGVMYQPVLKDNSMIDG